MIDHNIRRLRDELDLYKRANDQQALTIERLRRTEAGQKRALQRLEAENEALTAGSAKGHSAARTEALASIFGERREGEAGT